MGPLETSMQHGMAEVNAARRPRTIIDKLWDSHTIVTREDGESLLCIDRHFVHEGSHHGFGKVRARSASVARPDLTFGMADHYVPTRKGAFVHPDAQRMISQLERNCADFGIVCFGEGHPRQGID